MASRKERLSSKPGSLVMKRSDFSCSCFIGFDSSSCTPRDGPKRYCHGWPRSVSGLGRSNQTRTRPAELAPATILFSSIGAFSSYGDAEKRGLGEREIPGGLEAAADADGDGKPARFVNKLPHGSFLMNADPRESPRNRRLERGRISLTGRTTISTPPLATSAAPASESLSAKRRRCRAAETP